MLHAVRKEYSEKILKGENMKKHRIKKLCGVKIAEKIKKEEGRPLVRRTAVFADRTKYKRAREKARLLKEY